MKTWFVYFFVSVQPITTNFAQIWFKKLITGDQLSNSTNKKIRQNVATADFFCVRVEKNKSPTKLFENSIEVKKDIRGKNEGGAQFFKMGLSVIMTLAGCGL